MPEPDMSIWTGRIDAADGPDALRWHQMVKPLVSDCPPGVALIGFCCDEGVRRNGGRVGAKDGPRAIRNALANLAWHQPDPVYDAGNISCVDGDLEAAQARLAEAVASLLLLGHRPLVFGGGHETAWGTFQGIVAAKPNATVGVISIDAHVDLRADEPGNSGTPFYQMAQWCKQQSQPFPYLCAGVAWPSNTTALLRRAAELGTAIIFDDDFTAREPDLWGQIMDRFCAQVEHLHLSIDLDVLSAAVMPAVSAPAARGISLALLEMILHRVLVTDRVAAVEIVELNPRYDIDHFGARVAARLAFQTARLWESGNTP